MQYYKLEIVKRGRKCSGCAKQILAGEKCFVFFQFEKGKMQYPLRETFCLDCAHSVTSSEFLDYLYQLWSTLKRAQNSLSYVK